MTDYFFLLDMSRVYGIDLAALDAAYFRKQQEFHPDRYVLKPDAERITALQQSITVNQAYETLKSPLKRAQHLLDLHSIKVGGDSDSVKPSQELLMEVMELREKPPPFEKIQALIADSVAKIENSATKADYISMAQETLRLGYLMKISPPPNVRGANNLIK